MCNIALDYSSIGGFELKPKLGSNIEALKHVPADPRVRGTRVGESLNFCPVAAIGVTDSDPDTKRPHAQMLTVPWRFRQFQEHDSVRLKW